MPKKDMDLPDWSRLSTVVSSVSHALAEVKQMSNQVASQHDVNLPDWSKLSGTVLSRASDALTDARQLANQAYVYRNWSPAMLQPYHEKLWRLVMNSDRFSVHWTKAWATILSGPSNLWDTILWGPSKLWSIILWGPTKLWRVILLGSSKLLGTVPSDNSDLRGTTRILLSTSNFNLCTVLSCASRGLIGLNIWSIRHPYIAAAVLLYISEDPGILLRPLQLMGKPGLYIQTLPVPLNSGDYETADTNGYEKVDAHKAESTAVLSVSWLTGLGAVFVLGRTWGWWD